jgi:hypothetical protein
MLGVAHELGGRGMLAAQVPAELADDPAVALVEMHALTHERSAPAVGAAMPVGRESTDATAQQRALELLYVRDRLGHPRLLVSPLGVRLLPKIALRLSGSFDRLDMIAARFPSAEGPPDLRRDERDA